MNEEVNCTEPCHSVSIPWLICPTIDSSLPQTSNQDRDRETESNEEINMKT
jgi:hypothetical protein